jgi:hypothetical protein
MHIHDLGVRSRSVYSLGVPEVGMPGEGVHET